MINKKLIINFIIGSLLIASFTSLSAIENISDKNISQNFIRLSHKPILIDGNEDFTKDNGIVSGNGTIENPYIIENWNIRIKIKHLITQTHGISIRNSNVSFIIRNCFIHSFDGKLTYFICEKIFKGVGSNGINLYNVSNGVIENCYVKGMDGSINLENKSNNNIVKNCKCWRNYCGIGINRFSENNTVENCKIMNYGCSICLWDYTSYNKIINCSSKIAPIRLYNSYYNQVIGCTLSYCKSALDILDNSSNNTVTKCNFYRCKRGIKIYANSDSNLIYKNNFIKNFNQAIDECNNSWDNGTVGNYWSGYIDIDQDSNGIWDNPRDICGGDNKDRFPLVNPIDC